MKQLVLCIDSLVSVNKRVHSTLGLSLFSDKKHELKQGDCIVTTG